MSTQTAIVQPTQEQVAAIVHPLIRDYPQVGVAVGVTSPDFDQQGTIYYQGALLNRAHVPIPLDADTPFELASVSKTFTATLFALLAQRNPHVGTGVLGDYPPAGTEPLAPPYAGLALRYLATYTSGLPRDNSDPTDQPKPLPVPYTVPDMYAYLSEDRFPVEQQNTSFAYSNLGFALLGQSMRAAAGAEGSSYAELLRRDILRPLGLTATVPLGAVPADRLPLGFGPDGHEVRSNWTNPAYLPAGGLAGTPADFFRWLAFNMGMIEDSTLTPLLAVTQTPQTSVKTLEGGRLGFGWFLAEMSTPDGARPIVWKDGGLAGFSSYMVFLESAEPGNTPSAGGVFVLTNSKISSGRIARNVLRVMLGYEPLRGEEAARFDTEQLL